MADLQVDRWNVQEEIHVDSADHAVKAWLACKDKKTEARAKKPFNKRL